MKGTKYIVGFILLLSGITIDIFFFGMRNRGGYAGVVIPYPLIFGLIGIAIGIAGVWMMNTTNSTVVRPQVPITLTTEDELRVNGTVINVNIGACKIIAGSVVEQVVEPENTAVEEYFELIHTNYLLPKTAFVENVALTVLVYEHEYEGKKVIFRSPAIRKDKTTLSFLLAGKESTNIYVDKREASRYFWDLDFLEK